MALTMTPTLRARGFTMIDLLITLALAGVLASIAQTQFNGMVIRARRTEGVVGLSHLWEAQKVYSQAHDSKYAGSFKDLDFRLEGGTMLTSTSYQGKRYAYTLSQPMGTNSWYCLATANLDRDAWPDVLVMHDDEH
jgi:prepilin-type N-terminal cleavage/methylation domain-containing protein